MSLNTSPLLQNPSKINHCPEFPSELVTTDGNLTNKNKRLFGALRPYNNMTVK